MATAGALLVTARSVMTHDAPSPPGRTLLPVMSCTTPPVPGCAPYASFTVVVRPFVPPETSVDAAAEDSRM